MKNKKNGSGKIIISIILAVVLAVLLRLGANRQELSRAVLGVPVLAIGMPTVIDAGHFGGKGFDGMFVTPRNIDSVVRAAGRLIGYGINMAVHGLSVEEIDGLI